jgi:DNA-binding MarR family transcriptional regulator
VTQTVDRLVKRGFVVRRRLGNDSRGSEAVLTEAGSAKLLEASGDHALLIQRFLLDAMDKPTAMMVGDALDKVSVHLRTHRTGDHCELCAVEN